jgi:hypothetical protein
MNARTDESIATLRSIPIRALRGALVAGVVAGCLFGSAVANAQTPTYGDFTPDQARSAFVNAGYLVSPVSTWDWLEPPVSSFRVEDAQLGRVLLVQVNSDAAAAQIAERRVPSGYTASTWLYNLALFEATEADYRRLTDAAANRGGVDLTAAAQPDAVVDRQYTDLLVWGSASAAP